MRPALVDGRGMAFPGVSGAGKSTFTGLAAGRPGWAPLSDDRIILRVGERRTDGVRHAVAGRGADRGESTRCARGSPLPREGPAHEVRPITPGRPCRGSSAASMPWFDADHLPDALAACGRSPVRSRRRFSPSGRSPGQWTSSSGSGVVPEETPRVEARVPIGIPPLADLARGVQPPMLMAFARPVARRAGRPRSGAMMALASGRRWPPGKRRRSQMGQRVEVRGYPGALAGAASSLRSRASGQKARRPRDTRSTSSRPTKPTCGTSSTTSTTRPPRQMHSVITVTAWSENTTIYYDHWEERPTISTRTTPRLPTRPIVLATAGAQRVFESSNIPTTPRGTATYYDGGDRIFVAGGTVTVTRASWIEGVGAGNQAVAWEIYPVKPQLTTYVMPFGENLGFTPFTRVYALIQATANNTTFTVDLNGDGTPTRSTRTATRQTDGGDVDHRHPPRGPDLPPRPRERLPERRPTARQPGHAEHRRRHPGKQHAPGQVRRRKPEPAVLRPRPERVPAGLLDQGLLRPARPADGRRTGRHRLLPPQPARRGHHCQLGVEDGDGSSPFPPAAPSPTARRRGAVPVDSGLYFSANDVFWGVGVDDSLAPTPTSGASASCRRRSSTPSTSSAGRRATHPARRRATRRTTTTSGSSSRSPRTTPASSWTSTTTETVDQTLHPRPAPDPVHLRPERRRPLAGAHLGDGRFTMAYGENADTANDVEPLAGPRLRRHPGTDFISLVLDVDKSAIASGRADRLRLDARRSRSTSSSQKYSVDGVAVVDQLPPSWEYVSGSTTITLPDQTTRLRSERRPGRPCQPT